MVVAVSMLWMDVREPYANSIELEYVVGVNEDIILGSQSCNQ